MEKSYLAIPGEFHSFLKGQLHPALDEKESITGGIRLLLTSHQGECRFDPQFGCNLWNYSFTALTAQPNMPKEIETSVKDSIKEYEPRLKDVRVKVSLKETNEKFDELTRIQKQVRIMLTIEISATMVSTNQDFQMKEIIFLDPIATH